MASRDFAFRAEEYKIAYILYSIYDFIAFDFWGFVMECVCGDFDILPFVFEEPVFHIILTFLASHLHKTTQFTSIKCSSEKLLSTSRRTKLEHVYLAYRNNIYQQQHIQLLRWAALTDIKFFLVRCHITCK